MKNEIALEVKNLNFYYGNNQVLKNISIDILKNQVTALMGPSGCGKTTFLRCLNRIHDLYADIKYEGKIFFNKKNILEKIDFIKLRSNIGMIFQKPTVFPMSIFDNIAYGLKIKGIKNKSELSDRVEHALKSAALWEEVKHRLNESANGLSGGQQQRIVIARALAVEPEILLFDEPTSALDPISTAKIEELITILKEKITIIIVTHNLQQAARVSDYTAFMYFGELIEYNPTNKVFTNPDNKLTEDYITGRFG